MRYGASGMQGWRKRMEDSHISDMNIGNGKTCVFGVFDGHGGKIFSKLFLNKFVTILSKQILTKNFRKGSRSLCEKTFLPGAG